MAKEIEATVKINIPGGQASPAPPVGPALGQAGIPIMDFCNAFNEKTKDKQGELIPVVITVYEDRSFDFITKTPPTSFLIKKAAGIETASGTPNKEKAGRISRSQIKEIAEKKLPDLNTKSLEAAEKIVEGTANNMGVEIA